MALGQPESVPTSVTGPHAPASANLSPSIVSTRNLIGLAKKSRLKSKRVSLTFMDSIDILNGTHTSAESCKNMKTLDKMMRIPDSALRRAWDRFIYVMCMYTVLTTPVASSFWSHIPVGAVAIDCVTDAIFLLEIVMGFGTYFYQHSGDLCFEPARMRMHYLRGWFVVDSVTLIPLVFDVFLAKFMYTLSSNANTTYRLVRLLRMIRVGKIMKFEATNYTIDPIVRGIKLFLFFICVCHVIACMMNFFFFNPSTADMLIDAGGTALMTGWGASDYNSVEMPDSNLTSTSKYISASYLALLMLIGEDTQPMGNGEKMFTMSVMIVGSCLYATIFGSVSLLMRQMDSQKSLYHERMDQINTRMALMGLSEDLRARVRAYYAFIWKRLRKLSIRDDDKHSGEDQFLADLPTKLSGDIYLFLHKSMVDRVPIFKGCNERFLLDVVTKLKPQVNMPNDVILIKGEIGDRMFFVTSGKIVIINDNDRVLRVLGQDDFLGEFALLTEEPRSASAVAKSFCHLQVLLKRDFDAIMSSWPEYVEKMHTICQTRMESAGNFDDSNLEVAKWKKSPRTSGSINRISLQRMSVQRATKAWKSKLRRTVTRSTAAVSRSPSPAESDCSSVHSYTAQTRYHDAKAEGALPGTVNQHDDEAAPRAHSQHMSIIQADVKTLTHHVHTLIGVVAAMQTPTSTDETSAVADGVVNDTFDVDRIPSRLTDYEEMVNTPSEAEVQHGASTCQARPEAPTSGDLDDRYRTETREGSGGAGSQCELSTLAAVPSGEDKEGAMARLPGSPDCKSHDEVHSHGGE